MATGDFTGDGKTDVVFFSPAQLLLTVWSGNGNGAFGVLLADDVTVEF